jgi:hypothetical protein
MSIGSGIAVVGIWLAVAFCGYAFAPILIVVAPCALWATQAIAERQP